MKILICDGLVAEAVEQLQAAGHSIELHKGITPEALLNGIGQCEVVVVRSATKITREVIARAARLKLIVRAGVGLDNVDDVAARERGIAVQNTPNATSISVAEHTLGLMLGLARHLTLANASIKAGRWDRKQYGGTELYGKTLGVLGFGRIGQEVAKRALGFRMQVMVYDSHLDHELIEILEIRSGALDEILRSADYVSLHLPLTAETQHLINRERLALMKPGAYIINTARGALVDEAALAEAIRAGRIAGAAVDVYSEEPPGTDHPLSQLPQVISVPHLGAATEEGQHRAGLEVARIINEWA